MRKKTHQFNKTMIFLNPIENMQSLQPTVQIVFTILDIFDNTLLIVEHRNDKKMVINNKTSWENFIKTVFNI